VDGAAVVGELRTLEAIGARLASASTPAQTDRTTPRLGHQFPNIQQSGALFRNAACALRSTLVPPA
jgi:hypothetical protein